MNQKLSFALLAACLVALLINHLWVDWEAISHRKAHKSLDEIVSLQYQDLQAWKNSDESSDLFRKRTVCRGRLEAWSDNRPFVTGLSEDTIQVVENKLGIFLVQQISESNCSYISCHQLLERYSISNQYLDEGLSDLLDTGIKELGIQPGSYSYHDLIYYRVAGMPSRLIDTLVTMIILVVLLIEYWRHSQRHIQSFWKANALLVLLRYLSLEFDAFQLIFRFELFNPVMYTSSVVNPTLGDLLVNCLLLNLIILATAKYLKNLRKSRLWVGILSAINTILTGFVLHVAWTIISHSQLSLDVGQSIQFDLLRSVAYACILLASTSYFYFTYLTLNLVRRSGYIIQATAGALIAASMMGVLDLLSITFSVVHISILLISIRYQWGRSFKEFTYSNLLFILIVGLGTSAVLAFCIYKYEEGAVLDSKKKFANYLLLKRDVLGEYYLDQTIKKLSEDENLALIASERSRKVLEDQIRSEFLTPYFNKYDLDIVFQDYQQLKLNTRFTREFSLLTPENQSDYDNIYFIDDGANYKYICKVNVGELVGLIILQIKKRVPSSVYPALLTDNKYFSVTNDFDYAVFAGDDILFHRSKFGQGEWPQEEDFEKEQLYRKGIEKNERHYYGVKTNDGRTILIISDKYEARDRLTNFSFFFLLLLFSFGVFSILSSIIEHGFKLNFTSKIQLYLGMAFVIPLLITGFALLNTLNTSYREEINRSYIKQALYISEILSNQIEEVNNENGASRLAEISSYIQSDLSFYNESGYLVATSQPEIFNLNLQGNLINPMVFEELVAKENQSIIAEESVGSLDYKVCYAVVNTIDNQVAGFIAMPFFDSKNHLRRQQIEVFGNLITIFGVIFIIAIVFGNAVLNNLLHPLRMVAAKIRRVTLQEVNKPIEYESSDEIGSLVKDYNQMLVKLEDSKLALAKSQKETAWKEIAKQVAHEIKNPLTPMQLKIQQMLRKHKEGSEEHERLSSLLTQVDTLSQIAESFSAFAEMPAPDNQVFDWGTLVKEVVELYSAEDVETTIEIEPEIQIEADKDIFRRILNNIVLNAIQAVEEKPAEIAIKLETKADKGLLAVSDNGKGVPDELKDKIFLNYFSTKSKGSGIGLALAKKGIENAGGNIWFESKHGEGTTFFISMPLADS
ncbi:HAMP domain-containing protein [Ekhidna lutea]|uniref:histidine kinase n=1 Tax=Ekhidna lutea TaxID=447679 RepID=A0A239HAU4_EKHLU|nr:ATP-binding protein [Ekhidna lutea]SNS78539.1 HAMP domain-containing protein [Ekhidna lutea]